MQISGSNIPFSAMQAYGLKKPIAPKQAAPVAVAKPVTAAQRAARRERFRQVSLAEARGETHLAPQRKKDEST